MDEIKPEKQEQPRLILSAVLMPDKSIKCEISSGHVPTLTYVLKLLEVEVDKMIINQKLQGMKMAPNGIIIPKKHGVIDFIRGKRN